MAMVQPPFPNRARAPPCPGENKVPSRLMSIAMADPTPLIWSSATPKVGVKRSSRRR